jgi:hypothetical protein
MLIGLDRSGASLGFHGVADGSGSIVKVPS